MVPVGSSPFVPTPPPCAACLPPSAACLPPAVAHPQIRSPACPLPITREEKVKKKVLLLPLNWLYPNSQPTTYIFGLQGKRKYKKEKCIECPRRLQSGLLENVQQHVEGLQGENKGKIFYEEQK